MSSVKEFDTQVVIVSALKFTSKKGKDMTKLDCLFVDPELCNNNAKFYGCTPVTQWFTGHEVYEIVSSKGLALKVVPGHFVTRQDYKDPTKYSSQLESIKLKDDVITLLQSNN